MARDLVLRHRAERRRPPARRIVLVDDHRAHPFVEVVAVDDRGTLCGIRSACTHRMTALRPAPHLRQRNLEAGRRFGPNGGRRRGGERRHRVAAAAASSSAARMSSIRSASNSRSIVGRRASSAPLLGSCEAPRASSSTGASSHSASISSATARRRHAMGGDRRRVRIGRVQPLAGQRAIGADLARQPRQEPGGADIGKEADADLRHGEHEPIAGDAMRAVHRDADAAAHHDAVDQRHVGLADSA